MSEIPLFTCDSNEVIGQINKEIHFQLYRLQINCVELLSIITKTISNNNDEINNFLKIFLEFGVDIYSKSNVDFIHFSQVQAQLLRILSPHINKQDKIRFSRFISAGLILHKLALHISNNSNLISDILTSLYYNDSLQSRDILQLECAIIKEPHLSKLLLEIINYNSPDNNNTDIYSNCSMKAVDGYLDNPKSILNTLTVLGYCSSLNDSDQQSIKKLLSISNNSSCLLKHVTVEVGLKQTAKERNLLSNFVKDLIVNDLLTLSDAISEAIHDVDERLCYSLFLNKSFPLSKTHNKYSDVGWLILVTNPRGPVNILLGLINHLIEAQYIEQLCTLLKSPFMNQFDQLLLVNLWHPNLASVSTMQVLLDTCYSSKCTDLQMNYIEQLCLKIRTRWETLKKFNSRLSSMNTDHPTYSNDIIALTTMGNTSHLELIAGLSDPTGLDEIAIVDLLDRVGNINEIAISDQKISHLESEILEEKCDKAVYYCAVSIRKLWECLLLFSSMDTRQMIMNFLHQNNASVDVDLIDSDDSFYVRFRSALQNNDLELSEQIYQESIANRLQYIMTHINLINPLSLRLELLENLYSMLFMTEFDLFNPILTNVNQSNGRSTWKMPETIKLRLKTFQSNPNTMETIPNLNKNRFVCSFFLCKDLLVCLEYHLQNLSLQMNITNPEFFNLEDIDLKMADYISYPKYNQIKTRTDELSKLLNNLHWRIDLLTTNQLDFTIESIGVIDVPIHVIFDSTSRQLSDVFRPRANQKIRSKSFTSHRRPKLRLSKKRDSLSHQKTILKDPEDVDKSYVCTDEKDNSSMTFQSNGYKDQTKSSFFLFPTNRESSTTTSNEDGPIHSTETAKFSRSSKPKMNVHFLMEAISWIIEPIENLAITALVCGYKEKANHIAKMYTDDKATNPLLFGLLTEIRYQELFDTFVVRLGQISTPNLDNSFSFKKSEDVTKSFGHFDFTKLSVLNANISSSKENEVVEIVNHLLSLSGKDRPFLKTEEKHPDVFNKNIINNKIRDYNSGLLMDLALSGSTTKWQLKQMLSEIESHHSTGSASVDENKMIENFGYHKFFGLKEFMRQLHSSLLQDADEDAETYCSIEMRGAVDIEYFTVMQKWLSKLQTYIKLMQFNMTESVDFQTNNPDVETRWNCLTKLTDFIRSTSNTTNNEIMPYKYLIRSVPKYLESLQSHLEVFSKFLNDHRQSTEISITNQNFRSSNTHPYLLHEFSVLKRLPSDVLGELIFLKFIDPMSDEMRQISHDLGLNISEVVLQNCLPFIDSSADESKRDSDLSSLIRKKIIHNQPNGTIIRSEDIFNPLEVVTGCLEIIVKLFSKHSCQAVPAESDNVTSIVTANDSASEQSHRTSWNKAFPTISVQSTISQDTGSVSSTANSKDSINQPAKSENPNALIIIDCDWKLLLASSQDEEWTVKLMDEIIDLNNVDMDLLKTVHERNCFFINLYNLMIIHMSVIAVQTGKLNLKYRTFESRLLRENFCYNVGQMGVVSIHQISQYYLNIPDITFSDTDSTQEDMDLAFPIDVEQRYRNTCPYQQTLAVFGMTDGTVSGPPLKIYKPESFLVDLQNNLSYIIKSKSVCDSDKRQIWLPQIFKWYNKQIFFNVVNKTYQRNSSSNLTKIPSRTEDNLMERILSHCNEDVAKRYSQLLRVDTELISYNTKDQSYPKSIKIIWLSRTESVGCSLFENPQDISLISIKKVSNLKRQESTASNNEISSISITNQSNRILQTNYHPTAAAIDHLRMCSPLLACLIYTIIGDDFASVSVSSDSNLDFKRNSCEYIDEIHSYKFSRLQDNFPPIGNWIIRYWTPWYYNSKNSPTMQLNLSSNHESLLPFCRDNIPIEIRWAAFSHQQAKNIEQVLIEYSMQFMNRNHMGYFLIASALRNLHSQTLDVSIDLQSLLDMILVKSAQYWATLLVEKTQVNKNLPPDHIIMQDESTKNLENRLLDCIYAMKDCTLRLSETNRYSSLLGIHNLVTLMETNPVLLSPNNQKIEEHLKILRIFKRIHDLVVFCQTVDEIWSKAHLPTEFLYWQQLQNVSENNPDQVFKFLIQQNKFDLCRKWCQFYMKENGIERTDAEFIVSLVNENNDKEKVIELISHVAELHSKIGTEKFLDVVHHVIGHCEAPFAIIICCAFVIKNDLLAEYKDKSAHWQNRIVRAWVGASMLRSIPNGVIRDHYSHLGEHPDLIMEQLLMNSEIDLFRKMMELCREQRKAYMSIRRAQNISCLSKFSPDEFIEELEPYRINKLLIDYTFKALELPAVRVDEDLENDDVSTLLRFSVRRNSVLSLRNDLTMSNDSSETVIRKSFPSENSFSTRGRPDDDTLILTASLSPDQWTQDKDAPICMCCKKEVFSMFNRRHHCRKCGRVICGTCSIHRTLIKGVTVRICNDCYKLIQDLQSADLRARCGSIQMDDNKFRSTREMLFYRHNMHRNDDSSKSSSSVALTTMETIDAPRHLPMDIGVGALENGWRLSIDPEENETIRQMFYYDDAPSVTMAFSLTNFHSNSNECGNSLLDRVEYLADFLKPMKNGLPNAEVDYLLVIDIAKHITYKAKEKFSCPNNDVDFARAEVYLSRLDLMGILVRSNYSHCLPSLGNGSKFRGKIESLRDKLIREERLELARIVSSKAGLSNDPVFVAMGLHALEEGKYEEARKLFASTTRSGRYVSLTVTTLPSPLNEIMKILERNGLSVEKIGEMLNTIRDTDDLLKCPELKYMKECDIAQKQIEEAIYYFDLYSAPLHCLQFLCRQQMWSKATDYVIKKNISKDIFIDGLIAPAVSSGRFNLVKNEMLMREGGINTWKNYYEALCTHLDKKRCYEDLLEFQVLYGDHLRAAGTLVKHFYLRGAQSYVELEKRIHYLANAESHFEKLIKQCEINSNIEIDKYKRNLGLIKEQIEATKFLSNQISIAHQEAGYGYTCRQNQVPTLFSSAEIIVEFCLMILFCRPNMADGLQKLCTMMPQCHIYPEKILPKAAVWLLQNPKSVIQIKSVNSDTIGVDAVIEFCEHICNCYRLDSRKNDDVLISILPVIPCSLLKTQSINKFVALLNSEQKKIEAYILVKDFRRAYSNAAKYRYVDDVKRILELALKADDKSGVIDMCRKWLSDNNNTDS